MHWQGSWVGGEFVGFRRKCADTGFDSRRQCGKAYRVTVSSPSGSQPFRVWVWIDGLTPEQDAGIQKLAEDFKHGIETSPSADRPRHHIDEATLNDIRFQTRFGGDLWMQHHIQARHLAASAE
jgi:hypothetical protein